MIVAIGGRAAAFAAAYMVLLRSGRSILVPVVVVAGVELYRMLFRAGLLLAPFAATLVVLAVQNLAAGVLGNDNTEASLRAALALSAALPGAILLAGWLSAPRDAIRWITTGLRGQQLAIVSVAIASVTIASARFVTSPVAPSLAAPSLRNALTPAYGVLVVLLLPPGLRPDVAGVGRWIVRWGVFVALAGFVELRVLGDRFWSEFAHIGAAISVKTLSVANAGPYRVPADFYTYFEHNYFRRLVSLYGDAITTSYYLALALLAAILLARRTWRTPVVVGVLAVALVLGASKGAFGIVLVGLVVALTLRIAPRWMQPSGAGVVLTMCVATVMFGYAAQFVPWSSSVDLHVDGLATAVRTVTTPLDSSFVWGDGVGTAGSGAVHARRSSGEALANTRDVPGLDNGAGAIVAQTGLLGLVSVLALFGLVLDAALRRARENSAALLAAAVISALLANFLMQEHALTLITSLPFWFVAAAAVPSAEPVRRAGHAPRARQPLEEKEDDEIDLRHGEGEVAEPPVAVLPALAPPVITPARSIAVHYPAEQVVDDRALLDLMLSDASRRADVFHPLSCRTAYNPTTIRMLHEGLRDFRRRAYTDVVPPGRLLEPESTQAQSGGSTLVASPPQVQDPREMLAPFGPATRNELSMIELDLALFACGEQRTGVAGVKPVDQIDVSGPGSPFGWRIDERFVTPAALLYYSRYVYVGAFIEWDEVDSVVVIGAEGGEQVELLKRLHPHLSVAIFDHAPALYVAERFLTAAMPDDVVPYRDTRDAAEPRLHAGKIHFFNLSRLEQLRDAPRQLLWSSGFWERTDRRMREYLAPAMPFCEWMYFNGCVPENGDTPDTRSDLFPTHLELDCRPSSAGLAVPPPEGFLYEATFWVRLRRV